METKNIEIKKGYKIYCNARYGFCGGTMSKYRNGGHNFVEERRAKLFSTKQEVLRHILDVLSTSGAAYYKDIRVIEYAYVTSSDLPYTDFIKENKGLLNSSLIYTHKDLIDQILGTPPSQAEAQKNTSSAAEVPF